MRLRVHCRWAARLRAEALYGDFRKSVACDAGRAEIVLPPGFEYVLVCRDERGDWVSPPTVAGPAPARSECAWRPFPQRLRRLELDLPAQEVRSAVPLWSPTCALPFLPACGPGKVRAGRRRLSVRVPLSGALRLDTAAGPYYLRLGSVPPGTTLRLRLPEMATVRVRDEDGAPVAGAFVALQGGAKRPLSFRRHARLRRRYYEYGWTDDAGRIAVPAGDLEGRAVWINAWGFAPVHVVPGRDGGPIELRREPVHEIEVDLDGARGPVFGNHVLVGPLHLRPRFVRGRFLVPESVLRLAPGQPDFHRGFGRQGGTLLDYWSPAGECFSLRRAEARGEQGAARSSIRKASFRVAVRPPDERDRLCWLVDLDCSGRGRSSHALSLAISMPPPLVKGKAGVPQRASAELGLWGPACLPMALYGGSPDAGASVTFHKVLGPSSTLRVLDAEHKPPRGAAVDFGLFAVGGGGLRPWFGKGRATGLQLGVLLPDEAGTVAVGIPEGAELRYRVRVPGAAPLFGRLLSGEHATRIAGEPGSWALVRGCPSDSLRVEALRFDDRAQHVGVANFFSRIRGTFHAARGLAEDLIYVGPLPAGEFRLHAEDGGTRPLRLSAGRIEELRW